MKLLSQLVSQPAHFIIVMKSGTPFLGYGEQILLYVIISNTILKKNLCRAVA